MNIILPSVSGANSISFNIIPRDATIDRILLSDNNTNVETEFELTGMTFTLTVTQMSYYKELTLDFDSSDFEFINNHRYDLTVFDSSDSVLYKGLIVVTSQVSEINANKKYDNNIGVYTTPPNEDDEYIILE
tara:strand:- start:10883 stop:11278 length:396 start_codon:yes stop_codon:yes gene_type:complete